MTRKRCFWLLWLWLALCVCVPCRTHAQSPETLSGDTIDALWSRAVASWEQDAVDDTLSGLLEIEALDPEHAALHLALGAAYHRKVMLPAACWCVLALIPLLLLLRKSCPERCTTMSWREGGSLTTWTS